MLFLGTGISKHFSEGVLAPEEMQRLYFSSTQVWETQRNELWSYVLSVTGLNLKVSKGCLAWLVRS